MLDLFNQFPLTQIIIQLSDSDWLRNNPVNCGNPIIELLKKCVEENIKEKEIFYSVKENKKIDKSKNAMKILIFKRKRDYYEKQIRISN